MKPSSLEEGKNQNTSKWQWRTSEGLFLTAALIFRFGLSSTTTTTITNSLIVFYQAKKVSLAAIFLSCLFSKNVKNLPPLQRVIKFSSSSVKSSSPSSFLLLFSFSSSSSSFQDGLPNTIDTGKGRRKKRREKARERDESPCLASPIMRKPQMNRIGSLNGLTG